MSTAWTLLLTDLVDSTKLTSEVGDARAAELFMRHDRIARDLLPQHRGREIDRTDGFLLLFADPGDALRYALAFHEALAALAVTEGVPFTARVGLHTAPVVMFENRPEDVARGAKPIEIEGIAKPTAARIMSLAGAHQTLLTAESWELVRGDLPSGTEGMFHGHYLLKGVSEPVEVYEVGVPGMAPLAPPPDAPKCFRVVQLDGAWRTVGAVPNNLPRDTSRFVGRSAESRTLAHLLTESGGLVSLVGLGGTGKTRLALHFAHTWLGSFPGGAWWCDLSTCRTVEEVCGAVAAALDVPLSGGDPIGHIGDVLLGRGATLLLLDNFEHLAVHAADTVGRWVARAPDARVVVTSHVSLGLPSERVVRVPPLPLPDPETTDLVALADNPAVSLFVARAAAVKPAFRLGTDNAADVAAIVVELDGLPLAIELAAARVRMLPPRKLRERLSRRFDLLRGGPRGASERQSTLRGALDWSWELLDPWERAALAQCAVFRGGWTLEAAEEILDVTAWPDAPWPMDVLEALVSKSLVRTWEPPRLDGEVRFGMYRSIHEYAAEKLHDAQAVADPQGLPATGPEAARAVAERHMSFFATLGSDEALQALDAHGGVALRRGLDLEVDNCIAAAEGAVLAGASDLAVACCRVGLAVLAQRGPPGAAVSLASRVLEGGSLAPGDRAQLLVERSDAHRMAGQLDAAEADLVEALAIAHSEAAPALAAQGLAHRGLLALRRGRMSDAEAALDEALSLYAQTRDAHSEALVRGNRAILRLRQGRMDEARQDFTAALRQHRAHGARRSEGIVLGNLAMLAWMQGRLEDARVGGEEALAAHREVGNRVHEGTVLTNLGLVERALGDADAARAHLQAALTVHREVGNRRSEGIVLGNLGDLLLSQGDADQAATRLEESLVLLREVDVPRAEGAFLGVLASAYLAQGELQAAGQSIAAGEAILRRVVDRVELAKLLCRRGHIDRAAGDAAAARAALDEARALAQEVGATADSEVGRAVAELSALLEPSTGG